MWAQSKTSKSDLSKKLEAICDEIHIMLSSSNNKAYLIDGMAMFQSLNESLFKTFDDLSEHILKKILRLMENADLRADVITVVFDRYDKENSIKQMERERRGAGEITASHLVSGAREVPNYRCEVLLLDMLWA